MTTVCWDGQRLAADTLYVNGTKKLQGHYEKISLPGATPWKVEGKNILAMGFSGAIASIPKIHKALEGDVKPGDNPDCIASESFNVFLITDKKEVYYWNYGTTSKNELVNELFLIEGNHAIGSGGIYGLGIMAIKGNAVDGVRGAMKVDLHTGGYVDLWNFAEPRKLYRIDPNPIPPEEEEARKEKGETIVCVSDD